MRPCTNKNSPLGIILVAKDDAAERILFMYPFDHNETDPQTSRPIYDDGEFKVNYSGTQSGESNSCDNRFDIPVRNLAPLLCLKGGGAERGGPFEIKIDNFRFAGHPWKIEACDTLAVVFVLSGFIDPQIVEAFQKLSKKIAIAIDNEQQRCNYFKDQILLMQPAHDEFEAFSEEQKRDQRCPYTAVLERSGLAKHIRDIYEDIIEYGMVDIFLDDCIEVGFCIEPKAISQSGLTLKSSRDIGKIMQGVHPYHQVLFLDNTSPSPDSNPFVLRFFEHYEPTRSIEEMSYLSGLPVSQVLQIVRHYLLWGRAIVIYPICSTNVYTNSDNPIAFTEIEKRFIREFPTYSLIDVLDYFSLPSTLGGFLADTSIYSPTSLRMDMLIFLLRNELLVQFHTYIYLLPPPTPTSHSVKAGTDHCSLSARIRTTVNSCQKLSPEIKHTVLGICSQAIASGIQEPEVFSLSSSFVNLLPYTTGHNHIEDIIYRTGLTRSLIVRVLDTFAEVLCLFYCKDIVFDEIY